MSEAIPPLSFFSDIETHQFVERVVQLKNEENSKENGCISGVEVNLLKCSSNIANREKWSLIRELKDCSDIVFKSKEI